jgi:hypothetical protein
MEGERQMFYRAENNTKLVLDEVVDDVRNGDVISVEVRVDESGYLTVHNKCGS